MGQNIREGDWTTRRYFTGCICFGKPRLRATLSCQLVENPTSHIASTGASSEETVLRLESRACTLSCVYTINSCLYTYNCISIHIEMKDIKVLCMRITSRNGNSARWISDRTWIRLKSGICATSALAGKSCIQENICVHLRSSRMEMTRPEWTEVMPLAHLSPEHFGSLHGFSGRRPNKEITSCHSLPSEIWLNWQLILTLR